MDNEVWDSGPCCLLDHLAKGGSQLLDQTNPTTVGRPTCFSRTDSEEMGSLDGGYQACWFPIQQFSDQWLIISCLHEGQHSLNNCKKIGRADSAHFECGHWGQTPKHILKDCCTHKAMCQKLWPRGSFTPISGGWERIFTTLPALWHRWPEDLMAKIFNSAEKKFICSRDLLSSSITVDLLCYDLITRCYGQSSSATS